MGRIRKNNCWVSAHLFYTNPFEGILQNAVHMFINRHKRRIKQFFFIRFWKFGPHIRLRIKISVKWKRFIKYELLTFFEKYFKDNPSVFHLAGQENLYGGKFYPNNSIQFIRYFPEFKRYGGKSCMGIAERQFEISSITVLKAMEECENWSYEVAIEIAIQMHLATIVSMNININEAKWFLLETTKGFARSFQPEENGISVFELYGNAYFSQEKQLLKYCNDLWTGFKNNSIPKNSYLNYWFQEMITIYKKYSDKQKKRECLVRSNKYAKELSMQEHDLFFIYNSLFHMTNNRLGIHNKDEGFINFILYKFFEKL